METEHISLSEGQRILASVHVMCSKFRNVVQDTMVRLKAQEYAVAKAETVNAQQIIEAKRLAELQRVADTQTRPLTALEKARLMHLQQMQDKQAAAQNQPEILDKTFPQLLDQTASPNNYQGIVVEAELEQLITPFVQDLVGKVEELYSANQQLLKLAALCRGEALKEKSNSASMKAKIKQLEEQIQHDEEALQRLRQCMQDRTKQLETVRASYHKEVIQVKEHIVEQMKQGISLDDVSDIVSRSFDQNLLSQPMGKDDNGRSLDEMLENLIIEYDASGKWGPRMRRQGSEKDTEGKQGPSSPSGQADSDHARIMILQNERAQMQLKIVVLRHGLESWRAKAQALATGMDDEGS